MDSSSFSSAVTKNHSGSKPCHSAPSFRGYFKHVTEDKVQTIIKINFENLVQLKGKQIRLRSGSKDPNDLIQQSFFDMEWHKFPSDKEQFFQTLFTDKPHLHFEVQELDKTSFKKVTLHPEHTSSTGTKTFFVYLKIYENNKKYRVILNPDLAVCTAHEREHPKRDPKSWEPLTLKFNSLKHLNSDLLKKALVNPKGIFDVSFEGNEVRLDLRTEKFRSYPSVVGFALEIKKSPIQWGQWEDALLDKLCDRFSKPKNSNEFDQISQAIVQFPNLIPSVFNRKIIEKLIQVIKDSNVSNYQAIFCLKQIFSRYIRINEEIVGKSYKSYSSTVNVNEEANIQKLNNNLCLDATSVINIIDQVIAKLEDKTLSNSPELLKLYLEILCYLLESLRTGVPVLEKTKYDSWHGIIKYYESLKNFQIKFLTSFCLETLHLIGFSDDKVVQKRFSCAKHVLKGIFNLVECISIAPWNAVAIPNKIVASIEEFTHAFKIAKNLREPKKRRFMALYIAACY